MRPITTPVLLALLAGACMPTTRAEEPIPTRARAGFVCDAAPIQDLVGRIATRELAQAAVEAANAATLRYIRPGEIYTMEFREDRLNLHIDAQNRITQIRCG